MEQGPLNVTSGGASYGVAGIALLYLGYPSITDALTGQSGELPAAAMHVAINAAAIAAVAKLAGADWTKAAVVGAGGSAALSAAFVGIKSLRGMK
jgi:hypothetical protein